MRKVLGCSSPSTHTRIYYPLSTSAHPATHPYLASQCSGGRGAGGPVARPHGRGTGKARGDLPAVQSCGQETQGAGKGEAERAFSVALQNKNALQSRVSPQPISKSSWPGGGLRIALGARGDCGPRRRGASVRPAAVPAGGRREPGAGWAIPGRAGARRGSARPRRGRAAAAACSQAAAPRSVLCLFVGRRLPHTRCL